MKKKVELKSDEGFTFVETLAVLAVTALLAAQAGVAATHLVNKARCAAARAEICQFQTALQSYYVDCGVFPSEEQGLDALWSKPELVPVPDAWNGPYIERKVFADPWGTSFKYFPAGSASAPNGTPEGLPFVIVSYGADHKEGGVGNDSDIISWE